MSSAFWTIRNLGDVMPLSYMRSVHTCFSRVEAISVRRTGPQNSRKIVAVAASASHAGLRDMLHSSIELCTPLSYLIARYSWRRCHCPVTHEFLDVSTAHKMREAARAAIISGNADSSAWAKGRTA